MRCTQYYPVLMVTNVAECAKFYQEHFGFAPSFESDWYIHLQSREAPNINLALLRYDHETIPSGARQQSRGVILNFEVENAEEEYKRIQAADLPIRLALRDEAFGQRHFIIEAPEGTLIDIIQPIPPSAEFLRQYVPGAAAT